MPAWRGLLQVPHTCFSTLLPAIYPDRALSGGQGPRDPVMVRRQTTMTVRLPTPSTWPSITSPRTTGPTPAGVPVIMMSPGFSSK